jgi:hypothetical protein
MWQPQPFHLCLDPLKHHKKTPASQRGFSCFMSEKS